MIAKCHMHGLCAALSAIGAANWMWFWLSYATDNHWGAFLTLNTAVWPALGLMGIAVKFLVMSWNKSQ